MMQLNEGERRFQQVADSAPILMWRSDETLARDWVNRAWLDFTGRGIEQELGFGWTEGVHPDDRDRCADTYRLAFSRGEPFSLTYRLGRADGGYRWILENASPFTDEHGRLAGCFGSCTDVDDMVKANEALSRAVRDRAEAIAQRDHLLCEVQHRVRNNLQLILSIIDMQARADPASRAALGLVAARVRSIAKAQALLLDPTGNAEIDLAQYVASLAQGFTGEDQEVTFAGPTRQVLTPLSRAVPIGLIVNEILALLARDHQGALRIALFDGGGETRIEIETGDERATPGGPSKLVQRLAAQARAEVAIAQENPRKFVVRIHAED